ncbi:reverse transcriptase, partial [Globisporangium splendens]
MEGKETPMGAIPAETVELTNEHFPHLSSHEWVALERMRAVIGEAAVISLLRSASPDEQRNAATSFMHREIMSTHRQPATPVTAIRVAPLKLDVSPHRGGENEPLARWFVELDAAITARQLRDPMQQSWAYGKRLAEPHRFYDLDDFKRELKRAFEPPQSEFRVRAEFLKLRQGRYDLRSCAQRARYLVSSIVNEPIDVSTQIVTLMAGLNDGPIRNQLFREYPKTLDEAIERAMQEEFSIKQAKFNGFGPRPVRQHAVTYDGPEPMDISWQRQWPLPREQVKGIDEFFEARRKAGQVRESNSPHCSPTFCVKKATGGWRIVHAFNKLNAATIPAQTSIPRKDVIIDSMQGSTIFSTIDLRDGFYQILMREKDVPFTASCIGAASDVEVHKEHLRQLLDLMRKYKLYANIQKCMFGVDEIPVLGCFVGKNGVRPDPEKIKAINDWPVPTSRKDLRKFLGLATYHHKYSQNYAGIIRPLSSLLKKDVDWKRSDECQEAFIKVKRSLMEAPVLAIADHERPFYVVCDASDFAIGCALMQRDDADRERVICYQSRQLKPAERNYPVHDKELLAMKYALTKLRVYLLGSKRFTVYTDHASLRTAVKSPHLSQRIARWLSSFAEYEFDVEYKPGRFNVIADALSRRPDFESKANDSKEDRVMVITRESTPTSSLLDDIKRAYATDSDISRLVAHLSDPSDKSLKALDPAQRARLHRCEMRNDVLYYRIDDSDEPRAVVPNDSDLRNRVLFEYHDAPFRGHPGREKTYLALSCDFYWSHQYKWVRKYVRACEVCQRVKPAPVTNAPLRSLPVPTDCWKSVSMDFIFGLPADSSKKTGILVIVDRFSKMVHLSALPASVTAKQTAQIFLDSVFRLHGMPTEIASDRDPRFTAAFWQELFRLLGTQLKMSTADHPQTDGQTERVNRTLEDTLRSYAHSFTHWNECLPLAEFAINNSVHVSTGHTPFYANALRHPRVPSILGGMSPPSVTSLLSGGGVREAAASEQAKSAEISHHHGQATAHAAIVDKDIVTTVLQR